MFSRGYKWEKNATIWNYCSTKVRYVIIRAKRMIQMTADSSKGCVLSDLGGSGRRPWEGGCSGYRVGEFWCHLTRTFCGKLRPLRLLSLRVITLSWAIQRKQALIGWKRLSGKCKESRTWNFEFDSTLTFFMTRKRYNWSRSALRPRLDCRLEKTLTFKGI